MAIVGLGREHIWAYDPNANRNLPLVWNFLFSSGKPKGYSYSVFIDDTKNQS